MNPNTKLNALKRHGFKCIYCGHLGTNKNYLSVDHVYPQSLGGRSMVNKKQNLACACKDCNGKKKNMLLTDFIRKFNIEVNKEISEFL